MSETLADLLDGPGRSDRPDALLFDRGVPVTAERFRAEVARIAGGFAALGIKPGERVAIWLHRPLSSGLRVVLAGAAVAPVSYRAWSSEPLDACPRACGGCACGP